MKENEMEATQEAGNLIASDKVQGTNVYNTAGDNLGAIHDLMIDKPSGKVAYAIMSFGGFLGIGNQYHPLPWSVLKYDTHLGGYVVNLDKQQLEGAPAYEVGTEPAWGDRSYESKITTITESDPTGPCDVSGSQPRRDFFLSVRA
jgi:hypothetical protein